MKKTMSASQILRSYAEKTPTSAELFAKARHIFPSGVTHDVRYLEPHPIFISRAHGSRKWDVDGNEYVDYFGGHGALLLGHNHPAVCEAVREQLSRGVHYGASHELELEWATLIKQLIPCAERVRFTVTGTEATHLALRVARAYTNKSTVVRFTGHFHGWHDHVAFIDGRGGAGIVDGVVDKVVICNPDIESIKQVCEARNDIAAVILEPTGATFGKIPLDPQFLRDLRQLTARLGIVLIFDEVISGFRCSPGGAQAFYGVTPDLTTLGKIIAGGYPGAALVGRAKILEVMEFRHSEQGLLPPTVPHQGTYNAEPVCAAAGITTLKLIASSDAVESANRTGALLRQELNAVIRRFGTSWCVYGNFSGFHIFANPDKEPVGPEDIMAGKILGRKLKGGVRLELLHKIRLGLICGGADIAIWPGGLVSCTHNSKDIDRTAQFFEKTLKMLAEEGELSG